jgi:Domain of Unknown Function (DUF1080)
MARLATFTLALLLSAIAGLQYTGIASGQSGGDGWITLFDGKNLDQWQAEAANNATWRIEDGSIAVEKMDKDPQGNRQPCLEAILHQLRAPRGVLGQRRRQQRDLYPLHRSQQGEQQERLRG